MNYYRCMCQKSCFCLFLTAESDCLSWGLEGLKYTRIQNNAFLSRPSLVEQGHSRLGKYHWYQLHVPISQSQRFAWFMVGKGNGSQKKISAQFRCVSAPQETISTTKSTLTALTYQHTFLHCRYHRIDLLALCDHTYSNNDGGDESPADFEEQRRGEAQHHLHIFKILPVTCKKQNTNSKCV